MLNKGGLPTQLAGHAAWRILDTRFGVGQDFLTTWQSWRKDPAGPPRLHYVALTDSPAALGDLLGWAQGDADLQQLADALAAQWFGLCPGFHRISLNEGRVLLTLCVGQLAPLLRQQQFMADAVYLKPGPDDKLWDRWTAKALARCCRRGTWLFGFTLGQSICDHLLQCGFELQRTSDSGTTPRDTGGAHTVALVLGQYNPHWDIKHSRSARRATTNNNFQNPGTCAVIGAGLAGAGVAAALARRGWQVQVLDAGAVPAAGASGLPVGLVVPHVSADDCTLSRLSRCGVRLMLQQAKYLLNKGQDWDATGTLERRLDGTTGLTADLTMAEQAWSQPARKAPLIAEWLRSVGGSDVDLDNAIWHAQAAWLKPASLVRAWLAQPGITFQGHATVSGLRREDNGWAVLDGAGQVLARADRVVIANAMGALPLMASLARTLPHPDAVMTPLPALQGVRGQVSWGLHAGLADDAFPPCPVNGSGSVVSRVPSPEGLAWFVGANYQPEGQTPPAPADNHITNLARLVQLLPELGAALSPRFAAGAVNLWQNTRCVTTDRLPLVGPLTAPMQGEVQPSVWLCAGMGSRGLTFSALCAELLAAQWGGEPLPVEAGLAAALDVQRHAKSLRK